MIKYYLIYLVGVIFSMTLTLILFIRMHIDKMEDDEDDNENIITTIAAFLMVNTIWPMMLACLIILYGFSFFKPSVKSTVKFLKKIKGKKNVI